MSKLDVWKQRTRQLKSEVYALYLAYKDPRVPWYARVFAACVVAYAFSPIDLIPDPIPVLGYLDDLVLVPLGIVLARKMIPPEVLAECREAARERLAEGRPANWVAAAIIVAIWLLLGALGVALLARIVWH
ncbi:MAG: YkvA family protein [Chloroflexia bacterium]